MEGAMVAAVVSRRSRFKTKTPSTLATAPELPDPKDGIHAISLDGAMLDAARTMVKSQAQRVRRRSSVQGRWRSVRPLRLGMRSAEDVARAVRLCVGSITSTCASAYNERCWWASGACACVCQPCVV